MKLRFKFDDNVQDVRMRIKEQLGLTEDFSLFEVLRLRNGYC